MTHAVVEWLVNDATVQGLVGLNAEGDTYKIYQVIAPQDEKPPYIIIRVHAFSVIKCKGEASNEEQDVIQIDCYADSYKDTYTLYRAVRQVLDGNSFTSADGTEIEAQIQSGRDLRADEVSGYIQLAKRNLYCIVSLYDCEVKLGSIT